MESTNNNRKNVTACFRCAKKANILHEGIENCTYLCSSCDYKFIIHWDGSSEPRWPLSGKESKDLRRTWNKIHDEPYVCEDCGKVYSMKPKACKCEKFPISLNCEEYFIVNMDDETATKVEESVDTIKNMNLDFKAITQIESQKLTRTDANSNCFLVIEHFYSGVETMAEYCHENIKITKQEK